jgi:hypothetical protein
MHILVFGQRIAVTARAILSLAGSRRRDRCPAADTAGRRKRVDSDSRQVKNIFKLWHRDVVTGGEASTDWEILMTTEVESFLDDLYESDLASHQLVNQAILVLERNGPAEGRPLVDTITASRIANMKKLRPPSAGRSEIRILLVFDPWRSVILLWPGTSPGGGTSGTGQRSPAPSSCTTITLPSAGRR